MLVYSIQTDYFLLKRCCDYWKQFIYGPCTVCFFCSAWRGFCCSLL